MYRQIDVSIWNDEVFFNLKTDEKLIVFYLFTNQNMTPLGLGRVTVAGIAEELSVKNSSIKRVLSLPFFEYDQKSKCLWIKNFLKYNQPVSVNVIKSWVKYLDFVPQCELSKKAIMKCQDACYDIGEAFGDAFKEAFGDDMPYPVNSKQKTVNSKQKDRQKDMPSVNPPSPKPSAENEPVGQSVSPGGISEPQEPESEPPEKAQVLDDWNDLAKRFGLKHEPKCPSKRYESFCQLWAERDFQTLWQTLQDLVARQPFLSGAGDQGFKISLRWLLRDGNWRKVFDEEYAPLGGDPQPKSPTFTPDRALTERVLEAIKQEVSEEEFLHFEHLRFGRNGSPGVVCEAKDNYAFDWINRNYLFYLADTVKRVEGEDVRLVQRQSK